MLGVVFFFCRDKELVLRTDVFEAVLKQLS